MDGRSMESITSIKVFHGSEVKSNGKVIRWTEVGYLVGTNGQPLLPQYLSHLDSTLIPASSARAPSSWSSSSTSWRSSPRQRSSRASFVSSLCLSRRNRDPLENVWGSQHLL
ncbi:unnamed protein product [Arctogadus glacialis]